MIITWVSEYGEKLKGGFMKICETLKRNNFKYLDGQSDIFRTILQCIKIVYLILSLVESSEPI